MDTASYQDQMTAGKARSHAGQARPTHLEVSVSIRTILLIAGVVAIRVGAGVDCERPTTRSTVPPSVSKQRNG